jgi:Na+/proline symporter
MLSLSSSSPSLIIARMIDNPMPTILSFPHKAWQMGLSTTAIVYLIGVVCLSYYGHRGTRAVQTPEHFFLANHQLNSTQMSIAFIAACFGAGSTLGTLQVFGTSGWLTLWKVAIPLLLTCGVLYFLILPKLQAFKRIRQHPCDTLPETLETYYALKEGGGRAWLATVLWLASVTFVSSQMIAAIGLLKVLFPDTWQWAVGLGWLGLVSYITLGGFSAVVLTDTLQVGLYGTGMMILALSVLLTYWGIHFPVKGFETDWLAVALSKLPQHFHWPQTTGYLLPATWQETAALFARQFGLITAWVIAPEMWQRIQATRSEADAKKGLLSAWGGLATLYGAVLILCLGVWGLMSTLSPASLPSTNPTLTLAQQKLTPLLYWLAWVHQAFHIPQWGIMVILLGFLVALSSTMDSTLNIASQTLTRDMLQPWCKVSPFSKLHKIVQTPQYVTYLGQMTSVLSAGVALWVALTQHNILDMLMLSAEIYACCLGLPVLWMLWHPHTHTNPPHKLLLGVSPLIYGLLKLVGIALVGVSWYQDSLSAMTLLASLGIIKLYQCMRKGGKLLPKLL